MAMRQPLPPEILAWSVPLLASPSPMAKKRHNVTFFHERKPRAMPLRLFG